MTTGLRLAMLPLMTVTGCAAPVAPSVPYEAEGRPPISQCAALADIDWRRFDPWASRYGPGSSIPEGEREEILAQQRQALAPAGGAAASHQPSPDAVIVIRAYVPPAGHHAAVDHYGMTWREPDGQWWVWSWRIDRLAPPPPPPPPPRPGYPDPDPVPDRFPVVSGPASEEIAARLEAAWSDPCRVWEPDRVPWSIPLRRRDPETRSRLRECPGGGAPILGEITEQGRPPRLISYPCNMPFSTDRLLTTTAFAQPFS